MTITGIKIEFEGNVDTVEDRKEPFLVSRIPVGNPFKGSFQFYDTGDLWPEPGGYTTPIFLAYSRLNLKAALLKPLILQFKRILCSRVGIKNYGFMVIRM